MIVLPAFKADGATTEYSENTEGDLYIRAPGVSAAKERKAHKAANSSLCILCILLRLPIELSLLMSMSVDPGVYSNLVCHSERSEESMASTATPPVNAWT